MICENLPWQIFLPDVQVKNCFPAIMTGSNLQLHFILSSYARSRITIIR
mgnify:CR=1 FL=1